MPANFKYRTIHLTDEVAKEDAVSISLAFKNILSLFFSLLGNHVKFLSPDIYLLNREGSFGVPTEDFYKISALSDKYLHCMTSDLRYMYALIRRPVLSRLNEEELFNLNNICSRLEILSVLSLGKQDFKEIPIAIDFRVSFPRIAFAIDCARTKLNYHDPARGYITPDEMAILSNVVYSRIRNAIKNEEIQAGKADGGWKIDKSEADVWFVRRNKTNETDSEDQVFEEIIMEKFLTETKLANNPNLTYASNLTAPDKTYAARPPHKR